MQNTLIKNVRIIDAQQDRIGDVLIVDKSKEAHHNSIVIAMLEGEFTVKRLKWKGNVRFRMAMTSIVNNESRAGSRPPQP